MSYITNKDFLIEVQMGNVPGHSLVHKFGRNDAVPTSWEFVNLLGFTSWPLSAATTVRIKAGGDAADDASGAGAREVTVQGIDSTGAEISEAIVTAGVAASSATTALFWRIHRAWVSSAGTYGAANTAAVTIENGSGGTDLIQIGTEEGQTQFAGYTIPAGKTGYLLSAHFSVDAANSANFRVYTRDDITDTTAPMKSKRLHLFFDGVISELTYKPRSPGAPLTALSDFWVEAIGSIATEVSAEFEILLVDD